jgi:undecaprenyl-phosphate galactose phosphotransferase
MTSLRIPLNRFIKRTFDLVISVLLMPLVLPLVCLIAVVIKLDSKGPIFYSHTRWGRDQRPIRVYKFRSMYLDAANRLEGILRADPVAKQEWDTFHKLKNDPRITRVGFLLRTTSLDELPQFFNVFLGKMSLVGPRPVLQEELEKHYKEFADYYFMVKPGITGLWQVSGRNDLDYEERVKLDTWYVLNWSLWLDVQILFKTISVVVKGEGAF